MNKNITQHAALALAAAFALCGCVTERSPIEQRIALRQTAFDTLDAYQQERVRLGHIELGDTTDMLWMVFGEPTTISTNTILKIWKTAEPITTLFPKPDGEMPEELSGCEWCETWSYVREPPPWTVGPPPPTAGYQPGAMFAPPPPPPPERVIKIYFLLDGVIKEIDTKREPVTGN